MKKTKKKRKKLMMMMMMMMMIMMMMMMIFHCLYLLIHLDHVGLLYLYLGIYLWSKTSSAVCYQHV